MTVFADSSAIVKLYADEADHKVVRGMQGPLLVSALARVEVPSALWRKQRMGELSLDDSRVLVQEFEADWIAQFTATEPMFLVIGATASVIEGAAQLTAIHGLRAYEAVQLASAMAASEAIDQRVTFAAFDSTLCKAAAREGLPVLD